MVKKIPRARELYVTKDLLLEHKTVLGNIILPLLIQKVDKAEAIARADEILTDLPVDSCTGQSIP